MRTSDILTPPLSLQQKDVPPATVNERAAVDTPPAAPSQWTRICTLEEIPRLGARVIRRADGPNVAVFRTATDKVFALADRCPHRGGPLSQGIVFGERVACPLHSTCVDLHTGCAVAPDKGEVPVFGVHVENGDIYVALQPD
jgi:nitrite reductase (NADH) small subunit